MLEVKINLVKENKGKKEEIIYIFSGLGGFK